MCELAIIILAAGQGKRMSSDVPKVLHPLAGRPMIQYVVNTAAALQPSRLIVVVGHGGEQVGTAIGREVTLVEQRRRLGTGHAVMQAQDMARDCQHALVLYGDMPLLRPATLQSLWQRYGEGDSPLAMLILTADKSRGFGRVMLDSNGRVRSIVEEAECTTEQLSIRELNAGVYCFNARWLWEHLPKLPLHHDKGEQGEYFLTDLVGMAVAEGFDITYFTIEDSSEALGINTPEHLAEAEQVLQQRLESKGDQTSC